MLNTDSRTNQKQKYMKNTKTTKKNGSKASTVANNVKTPSARQLAAKQNGKILGRPPGITSTSLVSLETLIKTLPANAQIPLNTRFLREMNIKAEGTFVSSTSNLKQISAAYKVAAITSPVVMETTPVSEVAETQTAEPVLA